MYSVFQLKLIQQDSLKEGDLWSILTDRLYQSAVDGFKSLLSLEMNSMTKIQLFDAAFCANVRGNRALTKTRSMQNYHSYIHTCLLSTYVHIVCTLCVPAYICAYMNYVHEMLLARLMHTCVLIYISLQQIFNTISI